MCMLAQMKPHNRAQSPLMTQNPHNGHGLRREVLSEIAYFVKCVLGGSPISDAH